MRAKLAVDGKVQELLVKAGGTPGYIMEQLDVNGDGVVSWEEFESMLADDATKFCDGLIDDGPESVRRMSARAPSQALMRGSAAALRKLFDTIDLDGNGKVSPAELRRFMAEDDVLGTLLVQAGGSRDYCFEQLDENGDNFISWEEVGAPPLERSTSSTTAANPVFERRGLDSSRPC